MTTPNEADSVADDIRMLHAIFVPAEAIAHRLRLPVHVVRDIIQESTDAGSSRSGNSGGQQ